MLLTSDLIRSTHSKVIVQKYLRCRGKYSDGQTKKKEVKVKKKKL